jgi:hypothetical protein
VLFALHALDVPSSARARRRDHVPLRRLRADHRRGLVLLITRYGGLREALRRQGRQ